MNRLKAHWRILAVVLALVLWAAWYSRPVDVYGQGIGDLEIVDVWVEHNEAGQGTEIAWCASTKPGDSRWQSVLAELEGLRFRRPPGNLFRELSSSSAIRLSPDWAVVLQLTDRAGQCMKLQIGAGKPCYTSLHTGCYLPMSFPGGEEAAQSLAERLRFLLEESERTDT